MRAHAVLSLALSLAALSGSAGSAAAQRPVTAIDSFALRGHTYFLSHDLLAGRGTGSRGADVAALYLATQAERLGLAGAAPDGGFFQDVPIVEATITRQGLDILYPDSTGAYTRVNRVRPALFLYNVGTARTLVGFSGELAYVGTAADVLARAGRLPPLAGRVALLRGVFGAEAAAADTLRSRGVVGVVHLVGNEELFTLYVRSRGPSRLFLAEEARATSSFIPELPSVIVHPRLEAELLAGRDAGDGDSAFVVPGRRIQVSVTTALRRLSARNVAASLPGSDPALRHEYVVYTAHYDHLGILPPGELGDSVYNGFSDNAAGCAMLLAIARVLAARPPGRSVLFLWFTGEEHGLLGSDHFVANPLVPPAQMAGLINLDAGAPPAPAVSWRVAGGTQSTLGALAVEVARRAGWEATLSPGTPNTDYFPFLRVGVPAVFLVPGPGAYEGLTSDSSNALRRRWDRYHHPADHWAPDFPFAGLVRYADFALRLGIAVAGGRRAAVYGTR